MRRNFIQENGATCLDFSKDQIVYDILLAYATRSGYLRSRFQGRLISLDRKPLPWFTNCIEFVSQGDKEGISVFEFDNGNSTFYCDKCGAKVLRLERDAVWIQTTIRDLSNPTAVSFFDIKDDYTNSILEQNTKFDVVVIDGIWRNECPFNVIKMLSSGGVIILDNSDGYIDVVELLDSHRFVRVDFNGLGLINNYSWTRPFFFHGESAFSNRLSAQMPIMGIDVASSPDTW